MSLIYEANNILKEFQLFYMHIIAKSGIHIIWYLAKHYRDIYNLRKDDMPMFGY